MDDLAIPLTKGWTGEVIRLSRKDGGGSRKGGGGSRGRGGAGSVRERCGMGGAGVARDSVSEDSERSSGPHPTPHSS